LNRSSAPGRAGGSSRALFGHGEQVEVENEVGNEVVEFVGVKFPTFFRLAASPPPQGEPAAFNCPISGSVRIQFETDAVNNYFSRGDGPGMLLTQPEGVLCRMFLRNGRASLVVRPPKGRAVGDMLNLYIEVTESIQDFQATIHIPIHHFSRNNGSIGGLALTR
jgi:hypothetical protein